MPYRNLIELIQDGELVRAAIANRATRQVDDNVRYLRELFDAAMLGETVFARSRTVEEDAKVGMAVYWNPVTQQFERALGGVETEEATGELATTTSTQVWGVIYRKLLATKADILLHGTADIDLSEATDEDIEPGKLYFLSNSAPGKLTHRRPPVGVIVMQIAEDNADGTHTVYVNTKFQDLLESHRHYRFALAPIPAGDHSPPSPGGTHVITNPDPNLEGWLPATHANFDGKAPSGAKFGYNLAVSSLFHVWPPQPIETAVMELVRNRDIQPLHVYNLDESPGVIIDAEGVGSITAGALGVRVGDRVLVSVKQIAHVGIQVSEARVISDDVIEIVFLNTNAAQQTLSRFQGAVQVFSNYSEKLTQGLTPVPDDLVIIDRNGIWWMSDCYGVVPWPVIYGAVDSLSESVSSSVSVAETEETPESCVIDIAMQLTLWFTKPLFQTTGTAVLSLRAVEGSGLSIVCVDTGDPASTGHLLLDLDIDLALAGEDDVPGYLVFKQLADGKLYRGPVVESVRPGSSNVQITGTKIGSNYYGNLVITVDRNIDGREMQVDTVRLDGVTEEYYEETIALGFLAGRDAEYRGRVLIDADDDLPTGTTMKLRFTMLSRSGVTLPADLFSLTYRRVPEPATLLTPATLPVIDTNLADIPVADISFSAADEYFLVESEAFVVVAGDIVFFTLRRQGDVDAYAGDVHVLRQRGLLVAES